MIQNFTVFDEAGSISYNQRRRHMKQLMAVVLVFIFVFAFGVALAGEGGTGGTGEKGGAELNCMANWLTSHLRWGSCDKSGTAKEPAPVLTDEELKMQRENTGMGMRGRTK
jgi:hypothetical protein